MRRDRSSLVFASLFVASCNLYFGPDSGPPGGHHQDPDGGWGCDAYGCGQIDAGPGAPDAPPAGYTFAACSGGVLYASAPQTTDVAPADIAQHGAAFASCASRCRDTADVYDCQGDPSCADAATWLCEPDAACPQTDATCTGTGSVSCSAAAGCGVEIATETCTCAGGHDACASPCADGLCSPVDVLHAMTGHWRGVVTPPSFAPPYDADLVIAADGSYDADSAAEGTPFYYGHGGGGPGHQIIILGETPSGAVGTVGVDFGGGEILPGLITGVHADATHLSFHFWDSWLSCTREFDFELTRAP